MPEPNHTLAAGMLEAFRAAGRPRDWADQLPEDDAVCRALAAAFDPIGIDAYNSGDMTTAYDAFWHLFLLRLKLAKANASSRPDVRDFATAEDLLGRTMLELGDVDAAARLLGEALSYRQGLYDDDRDDPHAAYLYGVALWHMSAVHKARGDQARELALVTQARDHLVGVNARWSGSSFIIGTLADVEARLR